MSDRVVATEAAVKAGHEMRSILNGSLLEDFRRLALCGDRLADSQKWDGGKAADFRQRTWPQAKAEIKRSLDMLSHLQANSEKVVANIMAAGSQGAVASTVAGGGQGRSLWQKLGYYAAYIPLELASSATYGMYYGAYQTLKYLNKLPAPLQVPFTTVLPIKPGLVSMEAIGLGGDVGIDLIKNAVLHNGESWKDEGFVGPLFGNGLKRLGFDPAEVYLPGVHANGAIDWEW